MRGTPGALLERDAELVEIRRLLADADRGLGGALLVEGPPGIGKTRLLSAAQQAAMEDGFDVLATRAGELERELAWGVVRGLLVPALRALSDVEREAVLEGAARLALAVLERGRQVVPAGAGDALASSLHGLYWLTANLAARRPLVVAVDDAHWADTSSWRWLAYLAARVEELPIALLLTARPLGAAAHDELLRSVRREAHVLRPAPLSAAASISLVRSVLEVGSEQGFCRACHTASAGNPFLLSQLLRELDRQEVAPLDVNSHRVEPIGAEAVSDDVSARLARLEEIAQRLASAIAVIGSEATVSDAAALAGLGADEAAGAADELIGAGLLADEVPLRFVHPLVRAAVYENMPAVQRARSHARAAELLGGADAPPDRVAAHLVWVEPSGDRQVTEQLRHAAEPALDHGAPDAAIAYLRRALVEPPSDAQRPALLHLLGRAEVAVSGPGGLSTLEDALAACPDAIKRAEIALELSRSARMWGDFQRAARGLERAFEQLEPGSALAQRVEGELINVASCDARTIQWALEHLAPYAEPGRAERVREPGVLADLAVMSAAACQPKDAVCALARRALAAGPADAWDPSVLLFATWALESAGEFAEARAAWDQAIAPVRASGSALALGFAVAFRAVAVLRMGDVREAEADAGATVAIYRPWRSPIAGWFLAEALIERGDLERAEQALQPEGDPLTAAGEVWSPGAFDWIPFLHTRGCLRLAQGQSDAALADLLEVGRRSSEFGHLTPALFPWRSTAARALVRLGDREQARELIEEERQLARAAEVPHAIGVALRAAGLVEGGDEGIALLRGAVETLADSEARLEHARAVCELGACMRREGHRRDAQHALREALDLADRCGATALAVRAREELIAAGARPRRSRTSGPGALTASELRVARMAVQGLTNREIAQALFITLRTVETHLSHAYQKLDIGSRRELQAALGETGSLPARA